MKDMTLDELLRFGLAGGAFILFSIAAFKEPRSAFFGQSGAFLGASIIAIGLTAGSILYGVHRAVPIPIIDLLIKRLAGKRERQIDIDIKRWRNSQEDKSLQPRLSQWAAQIHLLYCTSWAGFLALGIGALAGWERCSLSKVVFWSAISLLAVAFAYHYRYKRYEERVLEEDSKMIRS